MELKTKQTQVAGLVDTLKDLQQQICDLLEVDVPLKGISLGDGDIYFYFTQPEKTLKITRQSKTFVVGDMYVTVDEGSKGPVGFHVIFNSQVEEDDY